MASEPQGEPMTRRGEFQFDVLRILRRAGPGQEQLHDLVLPELPASRGWSFDRGGAVERGGHLHEDGVAHSPQTDLGRR